MQVILIKDVDNLGSAHELVEVRPGYARNYLIPQKYAIEASGSNLKIMQERQKQLAKREAKLMAEIADVTKVLKAAPVKLGAKLGSNGKIFGSVTSIQLARAIREQKGYEIDRRRISITDDVKEAGSYKAQIDFGKDNVIEVEFEVAGE
ncbi:50S ribosomal protein L9 [Chitinophagaceae bacterium IBVUCB1]|jgi:large subunit ribosomal protein L9|nr:50S ribosomal protein L9 [Chitinophagaceae bacterium IBVUCB1]